MAEYSVCGDYGSNTISGSSGSSNIPAGKDNRIHDGECATVAGGKTNALSGDLAAVGGGETNTANGKHAVISGGSNLLAKGMYIAQAGGQSNKIWSNYGAGAGGFKNQVSGRFSVFAGSGNNKVAGHHSFATGSATTVVGDYSAGFGFGESSCFVPYTNAIRLCGTGLYLNGEELDVTAFSRRARQLLDDPSAGGVMGAAESKVGASEVEGLINQLERKYYQQRQRLQELLDRKGLSVEQLS